MGFGTRPCAHWQVVGLGLWVKVRVRVRVRFRVMG